MPVPFPIVKFLARSGLARYVPGVRRRIGRTVRVLHHLSDRILATPLTAIDDLAHRIDGTDAGWIDLSTCPNQPATPPPNRSPVFGSIESAPLAGLPVLRQRIAEDIEARSGVRYRSEDEVLVTHGGRGAFHIVADAFVNPGDRVVLLDPSPPLAVDGFRQRLSRIRWVPAHCKNGELVFESERLRRSLAGAKMIYVSQPASPTGVQLRASNLEQMTEWAERYDVLVLWDRSFASWECEPPRCDAAHLTAIRKRLVLIDRCGPAHIGWLVADAALLRACLLAAAATTSPPPELAQQQAAALLDRDLNDSTRQMRRVAQAALRGYVCDRLTAFGLEPTLPAAGPFVWACVSRYGLDGRAFAAQLAEREGVLVAVGDRFGPSGRELIRITYAIDEGRMREGLRRLGHFVHDLFPDRPEPIDESTLTIAEEERPSLRAAA